MVRYGSGFPHRPQSKEDLVRLSTFATMLVIVALVLSGCSSNATDSAATPTPAEPAAPPAASNPPAATPAPAPAVKAVDATPPPAAPVHVSVPQGTELSVILIDAVSSGTNKPGDPFSATLAAPLVVGGKTVLEKGT